MLSENPDEHGMPPIWDLPCLSRDRGESDGHSLWRSVTHLLGLSGRQLGTIPTVAKELLKTINQARKDPPTTPFSMPRAAC